MVFLLPTPTETHEDFLKAAWVQADLDITDLEAALTQYWEQGVLPEWYAPTGMPTRGELR